MNRISLEGQKRDAFGKAVTRKLRSEGLIPGVIYGGKENINFTVKPLAVRSLVYTSKFQLADITVDGQTYTCILKDIQFDKLTDQVSHLDFLQLVDDKKVIADLPLKFVGQPEGVKAGGKLNLKANSIKVRTYPKYLVEHIEVDISGLKLNENLRVQDVKVENMEVLNSPRIPIAAVAMTRALRQAEQADAKAKK
jgi:large subunit ribosomal protein L25